MEPTKLVFVEDEVFVFYPSFGPVYTMTSSCIILSALGTIVQILHGEVFTSVYKLSVIAKEEAKLLKALKQYVTAKTNVGDDIPHQLQRLLNDLEPMVSASCCSSSYAENPTNVFHLISRFVYKWPAVFSNVLCEHCNVDDPANRLNETFQEVDANIDHWPQEKDVEQTAEALLRLHVFYSFDIDDLIHGKLGNEITLPLSPSQVLRIINLAIDKDMLLEAKHWCEALIRTISFNSHQDESVNEFTLVRLLATIYKKANRLRKAVEVLSDSTKQGNRDIDADYKLYMKQIKDTEGMEIPAHEDEHDNGYKELCREDTKNPRERSKLYCYHGNTSIPFLKGKVEVVNLTPRILIYHEVLSDTETDYFRDLGSKTFVRSRIHEEDDITDDSHRVSQTSWLEDSYEKVAKASYRVGLLTGLDTKYLPQFSNAEPFQIVNYGIGGMYHPHIDSMDKPLWGSADMDDTSELQRSGDRIATWMYYLNDVTAGGATVFPVVNTRIPVIKGSAAFWYNLLPSGEIDYRTRHAGCPVLIGSKWIANKWIRETGQMFRRPCDLKP